MGDFQLHLNSVKKMRHFFHTAARRYKANSSSDMVFDKKTVNTTSQDRLLANEGNKDRFVKIVSSELQASNISTDQKLPKMPTD